MRFNVNCQVFDVTVCFAMVFYRATLKQKAFYRGEELGSQRSIHMTIVFQQTVYLHNVRFFYNRYKGKAFARIVCRRNSYRIERKKGVFG
jgi:hypothetical protein